MKRVLMAPLIAVTALSLVALSWRYDALALVTSTSHTSSASQPRSESHTNRSAIHNLSSAKSDPSISGGIATFQRTATLTSVAAACAATASNSQAGAVVLRSGVRQEKARVTFTVPCAIQLQGESNVTLEDMTITSRTLNFSDSAFGAGRNKFDVKRTSWTGTSDAGLLVKFSDPMDQIEVARTSLTYPLGISLQARGDRTEPDSGGIVELREARLSSHGDASGGITITASTSKGLVSADDSLFAADQVGIVADHCRVEVRGKSVNCNASALAADLKTQAQQAAAEQAAAQR